MWEKLPADQKKEFKDMILLFASLSDLFAQKKKKDDIPTPIVNSKFQETLFVKTFNGTAEDINNTSFDASINGETKYLVGLKTFGKNSGNQKIAQFKALSKSWNHILNQITENAKNVKSKDELLAVNKELYLELACDMSKYRNERIDSSIANLQGFIVDNKSVVEQVYLVLMPHKDNGHPRIAVGETAYSKIDIKNIEIVRCSGMSTPTNFSFSDGNHEYSFSAADSQLSMNFKNNEIIIEEWNVEYAEDAFSVFKKMGNEITIEFEPKITESYTWPLLNNKGEVELFSGFNGFFGVGSKLASKDRIARIKRLETKYGSNISKSIVNDLTLFLTFPATKEQEKLEKMELRKHIHQEILTTNNNELINDVLKLLFRPKTEMYIPIPNSKTFHTNNPTFFTKVPISFKDRTKLATSTEDRTFNLVFEPSGHSIKSFIAQDGGKAIESIGSMGILGEWILRGIFQLKEYEPLTAQKLAEIEINAIEIFKIFGSDDIHIRFINSDKLAANEK